MTKDVPFFLLVLVTIWDWMDQGGFGVDSWIINWAGYNEVDSKLFDVAATSKGLLYLFWVFLHSPITDVQLNIYRL